MTDDEDVLEGATDAAATDDQDGDQFFQAEARLAQICKYSHKILRKYIVNGMISFADGPHCFFWFCNSTIWWRQRTTGSFAFWKCTLRIRMRMTSSRTSGCSVKS